MNQTTKRHRVYAERGICDLCGQEGMLAGAGPKTDEPCYEVWSAAGDAGIKQAAPWLRDHWDQVAPLRDLLRDGKLTRAEVTAVFRLRLPAPDSPYMVPGRGNSPR